MGRQQRAEPAAGLGSLGPVRRPRAAGPGARETRGGIAGACVVVIRQSDRAWLSPEVLPLGVLPPAGWKGRVMGSPSRAGRAVGRTQQQAPVAAVLTVLPPAAPSLGVEPRNPEDVPGGCRSGPKPASESARGAQQSGQSEALADALCCLSPLFLQRAFSALCHSTHLYGRRLVLEWADSEVTLQALRRKTAERFHGKSGGAAGTAPAGLGAGHRAATGGRGWGHREPQALWVPGRVTRGRPGRTAGRGGEWARGFIAPTPFPRAATASWHSHQWPLHQVLSARVLPAGPGVHSCQFSFPPPRPLLGPPRLPGPRTTHFLPGPGGASTSLPLHTFAASRGLADCSVPPRRGAESTCSARGLGTRP